MRDVGDGFLVANTVFERRERELVVERDDGLEGGGGLGSSQHRAGRS